MNSARFYDPQFGRFIGRDPIGYGDGWNVYQYVGGSPIGSIDPSGNDGIHFKDKASAKSFAEELEKRGARHVKFFESKIENVPPSQCAEWVYTDYRDLQAVFKYADEKLPAATSNTERNEFLLSIGILPNQHDGQYFAGQELVGKSDSPGYFNQTDPADIAKLIKDDPFFIIDIGGEGRNSGAVNINVQGEVTTPWDTDVLREGAAIPLLFMIKNGAKLPFKSDSVHRAVSQSSPWDFPPYPTEIPRVVKSGGTYVVHVATQRNLERGIKKFKTLNPQMTVRQLGTTTVTISGREDVLHGASLTFP